MIMYKNYIVGIDIGKEGAISVLSYTNNIYNAVYYTEMPITEKELLRKLTYIKNKYKNITEVCIEKQGYMSKSSSFRQSGKGAFTLGFSQGIIQGILLAYNINYSLIAPKTWQLIFKDIEINTHIKNLCKDSKKLSSKLSKQKSLTLCNNLFPSVPLMTRRGRILDGIADSLCIAYWKYINIKKSN